MFQLRYIYFFIITILIFINISNTLPNPRIVRVENYSIPVAENGSFYLYEVYANKVVLETYPAFYFDKKDFKLNTIIRNAENKTEGQIIGNYLHYYPIAPRAYKKMYCEDDVLQQLVGDNYVQYKDDKCAIVSEFYRSMLEYKGIDLPRKNQCYIYM